MRARRHAVRAPLGGAVERNMTPMIDVVFLLVIFFLVSSNLAARTPRPELDLPAAGTGQREQAAGDTIVVSVRADGETLLGAAPVELAELRRVLAERVSGERRPPRVRLRADRRAEYESVEPVLAAIAEAGVSDVALAVEE